MNSGRLLPAGWGERALLGMVHLLPLPGAPQWRGSMREVLDRAESDAGHLLAAGFHGIVVENFGDVPFHPDAVPPETVAALAAVVGRVRAVAPGVAVGVNVLRNDARAALAVAAATGAAAVRINVHTGAMWTDQGLLSGRAHETMRIRRWLAPDVSILADVHVKHATPPEGERLEDAARDCWERGGADVLVVSGTGTGRTTELDDVRRVRRAVPEARVFVGSGVSPSTVFDTLAVADGVIVGSALMRDGRAGGPIDPERARALVASAHR